MKNEGKIKTVQSHKLTKLATNRLSMKEILKDDLQTKGNIVKEVVMETRKTLKLNENIPKSVTLARRFVTLNAYFRKEEMQSVKLVI